MQILQVVPGISPGFGGPSIALTDMTRLLCEQGIEATLLTTNIDPTGRLDVPLGVLTEQRGARVLYYNTWPRNRYAFSASMAWALLKTIRRYDVVHIHWLFNFSCLAAAIAARRAGVPYVFQPNGSLDPHLMTRNTWIKRFYIHFLGDYIIRHAAAIIFTTEAERAQAYGVPASAPTRIFPVGLDWRDYATLPAKGKFRVQFPETQGKQVILFLSRLSRQKGIDLLIPAFKEIAQRFPRAHLVLAGPDGEGYGTQVREWVASAGLQSKVTFAGRLSDELKLAAYVDSDLFVLPSHAENFGAVVMEALACELPVVISDHVNTCEAVARGRAGVVVKCESASVAEGMAQLLSNPALGHEYGQNGRRLVQAEFTWDAALDRLIPLYRELAARRNPARERAIVT